MRDTDIQRRVESRKDIYEDYLKQGIKNEKKEEDIKLAFLKYHADARDFLTLAISYEDSKITDICNTIKKIQSASDHRKVTDKQRYAIAKFLLEKNNNDINSILNKMLEII